MKPVKININSFWYKLNLFRNSYRESQTTCTLFWDYFFSLVIYFCFIPLVIYTVITAIALPVIVIAYGGFESISTAIPDSLLLRVMVNQYTVWAGFVIWAIIIMALIVIPIVYMAFKIGEYIVNRTKYIHDHSEDYVNPVVQSFRDFKQKICRKIEYVNED